MFPLLQVPVAPGACVNMYGQAVCVGAQSQPGVMCAFSSSELVTPCSLQPARPPTVVPCTHIASSDITGPVCTVFRHHHAPARPGISIPGAPVSQGRPMLAPFVPVAVPIGAQFPVAELAQLVAAEYHARLNQHLQDFLFRQAHAYHQTVHNQLHGLLQEMTRAPDRPVDGVRGGGAPPAAAGQSPREQSTPPKESRTGGDSETQLKAFTCSPSPLDFSPPFLWLQDVGLTPSPPAAKRRRVGDTGSA